MLNVMKMLKKGSQFENTGQSASVLKQLMQEAQDAGRIGMNKERMFFAGEGGKRRLGPTSNLKGDPSDWNPTPATSEMPLKANFTEVFPKTSGPRPKTTTPEAEKARQDAIRGQGGDEDEGKIKKLLAKLGGFARERPVATAGGLGAAGIGLGAMAASAGGGGEEGLDPAVAEMLRRRQEMGYGG